MKAITLTTDFGLSDAYVGAVRGVILSQAPGALPVDNTHLVSPGAVLQGAYLLKAAYRHFPEDSIHLAIVDPGVGTPRRALAIRTISGHTFCGPDNGILSYVLRDEQISHIVQILPELIGIMQIAPTFHGRDLFAPAACFLANGGDISALGPTVSDPIRLQDIDPQVLSNGAVATVLHLDRFGNAVFNLEERRQTLPCLGSQMRAERLGILKMGRTFADVESGRALAYIGSSGHLEIAINGGSAAHRFNLRLGARETLLFS